MQYNTNLNIYISTSNKLSNNSHLHNTTSVYTKSSQCSQL